jgi:outer membrane protein OmpA-like peptidoglycan-associated protein
MFGHAKPRFIALAVIALVACSSPASMPAPVPHASASASPAPIPSASTVESTSVITPPAPPMPSASATAASTKPPPVVICYDCNRKPEVTHINFSHKNAQISKAYLPVLEVVAEVLAEHPDVRVELQGHIDSSEREYLQYTYGHHRANAVKKWLMLRGIDGNRLMVRDYGDSVPLIIPKNNEERAINRRVEFKSIPQQP